MQKQKNREIKKLTDKRVSQEKHIGELMEVLLELKKEGSNQSVEYKSDNKEDLLIQL